MLSSLGTNLDSTDSLVRRVDAWLLPLPSGSGPTGPDLEQDSDYLALAKAMAGKPEGQIGEAAVPPDFRAALGLAESLLNRTRDLRVASAWVRAALRQEGIAALSEGLRLLSALMETFGAQLHPVPDTGVDEGDSPLYARANELATLPQAAGLLGDLRQAVLLSDRVLGPVRSRSVELSLGTLQPRANETVLDREQLTQFFSVAPGSPDLRDVLEHSQTRLRDLARVCQEQLGPQESPRLDPLVAMLSATLSLMPKREAKIEALTPDSPKQPSSVEVTTVASKHGALNIIQSRADAIRAIDLVCEYLERVEPANPAPLLLRRAKGLLDKNFLQLMNVFAPTAMEGVAKLMGIDPATITSPPSVL